MRYIKSLFVWFALAVLAGCGGGGGSSGSTSFGPGSGSGSGSGGGTGGGTTTGPTVTLSLSSTTITSQSPATLTVTVRDASGAALSGRVVNLSLARGGLAVLAATSALTDASGVATIGLQAAAGGLTGADEVVASAVLGTTTVQSSIGFSVSGATATISAAVSSTTVRASAGPVTVSATVRDAAGQPLSGQVVRFASSTDALLLAASSALTNASGVATTTATARDSSLSAADSLVVSARANGQDLQSSVNVQLVGETPSLALTLSTSTVSTTATSTVQALVRDPSGVPVSGAVVSFRTQFGLGIFDAATAATNASGIASVVLSPAAPSSSGADYVLSSVTVSGVSRTSQAVVQFAPGSGTAATGTPTLALALSSSSISAAQPATATATLTDSRGSPVAGQVVDFRVVRGLAVTNVGTALTDATGRASVVVSPSSSATAGADEVNASVSFTGTALQATRGFQINATPVTLSFTALSSGFTLSAYGQTTLVLNVGGASAGSPVSIGVTSSCVTQGKATLSPASFSATTGTVSLQYRDNGCGALQASDQLQATVLGAATSAALTVPLSTPAATSIAFVSASPESIFIRGSGFDESSVLTFQVRDSAGNALPNLPIDLRLLTGAGGVTMEGRTAAETQTPNPPVTVRSDAQGRVVARINSGTVPTPVRVQATLASAAISTVSSNLGVGVGLPSQLNFSMSQSTRNIEGYNIDGTPNSYQVIASDRSGNPVPAGTSINFVTTGGQVEPIRQIQLASGIARTSANYVSASPRPVDGRITVTAYALGEESFIDTNGNNVWDAGEPFQDLGTVFLDRNYDGTYTATVEETIPLGLAGSAACQALPSGTAGTLLALDPSIPSAGGTSCDGRWSGAGQVYVRRAVQTVLSTSAARPLWANTSGLDASCRKIRLQDGQVATSTGVYTAVTGDTWYGGGSNGSMTFIVGDANPGRLSATPSTPFDPLVDYEVFPRLNPMPAGTVITVTTPTADLTVTVAGGTPVGSTTEATLTTVAYSFANGVTSGVVTLRFRSPSGVETAYNIGLSTGTRTTACPP